MGLSSVAPMSNATIWSRLITARVRRTRCHISLQSKRVNSTLSRDSAYGATTMDSISTIPSEAASVGFDDFFSAGGLYLQRIATAMDPDIQWQDWLEQFLTVEDMADLLKSVCEPWHPHLLADPDGIHGICTSISTRGSIHRFIALRKLRKLRMKILPMDSTPRAAQPDTNSEAGSTVEDTQTRSEITATSRSPSHPGLTGQSPNDSKDEEAPRSSGDDSSNLLLQSDHAPKQTVGRSRPISNPQYASSTSRVAQPHMIALIDGDGYVFSEELILKGRDGGIEAATRIAESVSNFFDQRQDFRLSIYLFMNRRGLVGMLVGSARQYRYDLINEFLNGFQSPPFNYVIDPGPGKERVDAKLKELMRVSLRAPDTECVILGVGHDTGYIPNIEGEVLFRDKIKLLIGDKLHDSYKRDLAPLSTIAVPGLFEWRSFKRPQERLNGGYVPGARNGEIGYRRATVNGVASRDEDASVNAILRRSPVGVQDVQVGKELGEETSPPVRKRVSRKDPKDRKALAGRGVTARGACKNAWIAEHPNGTEGQFQAYWEREGQVLYKDWKKRSKVDQLQGE